MEPTKEDMIIIINALLDEKIKKSLFGKKVKKIVYIREKLINFVTE